MPTTADPTPHDLNALPAGTQFGELEILRLIGAGGFGLVYLAKDHLLDRLVAIKEYMPGQMAQRTSGAAVSLRTSNARETFELGRRSFMNEARLLARFDHRSLLKVYRYWEANDTAYMAMPYLEGQTLMQWRQTLAAAPSSEWLTRMLMPLLEALEQLHAAQVFHRDISPDNIFLPAEGGDAILLDFGAARRAISDRTQSFTAILKPSYAPLEQYDAAGTMRQGPWTDLYALGAVIHHMLVGMPPPPATQRAIQDALRPLSAADFPNHAPGLLKAANWALQLRPNQRAASVTEFRAVLLGLAEPANTAQAQAQTQPSPAAASPTAGRPAAQPAFEPAPETTLPAGYWRTSGPLADPTEPQVAGVKASNLPAADITGASDDFERTVQVPPPAAAHVGPRVQAVPDPDYVKTYQVPHPPEGASREPWIAGPGAGYERTMRVPRPDEEAAWSVPRPRRGLPPTQGQASSFALTQWLAGGSLLLLVIAVAGWAWLQRETPGMPSAAPVQRTEALNPLGNLRAEAEPAIPQKPVASAVTTAKAANAMPGRVAGSAAACSAGDEACWERKCKEGHQPAPAECSRAAAKPEARASDW